MKTLVLLSVSLAVALGMPKPPPVVEQNSAQKEEKQSPLVGDWVPAQAHVVVEDPAPQPILSSKEQQENQSPVDLKQSENVAEPEDEEKEKELKEVEAEVEQEPDKAARPELEPEIQEPDFKAESEVKVDVVQEDELEPETEPEQQIQPDLKVESEVKVDVVQEDEIEPETEPEQQIQPDLKVESEVKVDVVQEDEIEPETEPEQQIQPDLKVESEVMVELADQEKFESEAEEEFPVQMSYDTETDPDLEEEDMINPVMDHYRMTGGEDSELLKQEEEEEAEEEEEEDLMEKGSDALYGPSNMEVDPEMMGENFENPVPSVLEDESMLDQMWQQMAPSENSFPNEEAMMEMNLEEEDESHLLMEEEEEHSPFFQEIAMQDGGLQSEEEVKNEQTLMREGPHMQGRHNCPGVIPDGRCYQFFRGPKTFADAELFCRQHFPEGNLASISSPYIHREVMKLILKQTGTYTRAWIGGKRIDGDGFTWLDGSQWNYADWLFGEPNNTSGMEECLEVVGSTYYGDGKFNDFTCWTPQAFICAYRIR